MKAIILSIVLALGSATTFACPQSNGSFNSGNGALTKKQVPGGETMMTLANSTSTPKVIR